MSSMGKDGKKGSESGKKRRKKNGGLPEVSWKEAVLAYQISSKERLMEDVNYELKTLQDQNTRYKERNARLKLEQTKVMNDLLKASNQYGIKLRDADVFTADQVTVQMNSNWELQRICRQELSDIQGRIETAEAEMSAAQQALQHWTDYKDHGQHEHYKQIRLLQQELVDMQNMFDEMSAHLTKSLASTNEQIQTNVNKLLDNQKFLATQKAVAKMDKYSRREVIDNNWLTNETELHRRETADLFSEVEALEEGNLILLSQLFQCQVEDLQVSRSCFMTQMDANDLIEVSNHEIDLSKINFDRHLSLFTGSGGGAKGGKEASSKRPQSAIHRAVEEKLLALDMRREVEDEDETIGENVRELEKLDDDVYIGRSENHHRKKVSSKPEDDTQFLYNQYEGDEFEEYLKLGSLEIKLLSIYGERMKVVKPPTPSQDEVRAIKFRCDDWPVTRSMLLDTLQKGKSGENVS